LIDGIKVIDGHMHLLSTPSVVREENRLAGKSDSFRKGYQIWKEGFKKRFNSPFAEKSSLDNRGLAAAWCSELDEAGVDIACFIAEDQEDDELTDFLSSNPKRFLGLTTIDPRNKNAIELLRHRIKDQCYHGLKLYPTTLGFSVADPMLYPIYEEARGLGIPIVIHMGITLSYEADLRYANPIDLHAPARDFPELNFIIPHFGAGFFRELLFLAYHLPNVVLDTSGTNRWIEYVSEKINLEDVFKKALFAFGPEKIIFGTDSRSLSQGYRTNVLYEQLNILKGLNLGRTATEQIFCENAQRIYSISL